MIQVTDLTRYYGEFPAIQNVSFSVQKGEIVGLLGRNGAGKSTTLKILAGLMVPSSGSVSIDGADLISAPDAIRSDIGFLPEDPPLYRDMTITGFLIHMGHLRGMATAEVNRRLPFVLHLADLTDRADDVISTLSHGYRKRVGIAQAIINDPKLVILDEPFSGLDPAQIVEMRDVIAGLREGRVVLISSHILGEISQTCDRILVVHEGRLVAHGTEAELASRTSDAARIEVTVRGEAAAFQKWADGHALVTTTSERPASEGFASLLVELREDKREDFLAELVGAGFGLRLVETPMDELEEIFLGLTKEGSA